MVNWSFYWSLVWMEVFFVFCILFFEFLEMFKIFFFKRSKEKPSEIFLLFGWGIRLFILLSYFYFIKITPELTGFFLLESSYLRVGFTSVLSFFRMECRFFVYFRLFIWAWWREISLIRRETEWFILFFCLFWVL